MNKIIEKKITDVDFLVEDFDVFVEFFYEKTGLETLYYATMSLEKHGKEVRTVQTNKHAVGTNENVHRVLALLSTFLILKLRPNKIGDQIRKQLEKFAQNERELFLEEFT